MKPFLIHPAEDCRPASEILDRIGDKWSVMVVMRLSQRSMRFTELKRSIDGVSQRMLTLTLRALERDGIVTRTVTPVIPPRVDYALTELGRTLCAPAMMLGQWAVDHRPAILEARRHYDARTEDAGAVYLAPSASASAEVRAALPLS